MNYLYRWIMWSTTSAINNSIYNTNTQKRNSSNQIWTLWIQINRIACIGRRTNALIQRSNISLLKYILCGLVRWYFLPKHLLVNNVPCFYYINSVHIHYCKSLTLLVFNYEFVRIQTKVPVSHCQCNVIDLSHQCKWMSSPLE